MLRLNILQALSDTNRGWRSASTPSRDLDAQVAWAGTASWLNLRDDANRAPALGALKVRIEPE